MKTSFIRIFRILLFLGILIGFLFGLSFVFFLKETQKKMEFMNLGFTVFWQNHRRALMYW